MKFQLLDEIIEQTPERIVAIKQVSLAEEYLADHFPTFPVLPGVMMIETMAQAARRMLAGRGDARLVLGEVKALKFGSMVRPGEILEVEVTVQKDLGEGRFLCRGTGRVRRPARERDNIVAGRPSGDHSGAGGGSADPSSGSGETAVSGRFTMRPIRVAT
jgi:3-hydroxymyristoyl/3-hydroxydecanoyl-(acyl carrier protein) dehydratase